MEVIMIILYLITVTAASIAVLTYYVLIKDEEEDVE